MKLVVTKGVGSGPTELVAFDRALYEAGIANFNLVYLSSVIPVGSSIECSNPNLSGYNFGSKLYVVMSKKTEIVAGKEAWAGIGWMQMEDGSGLFIEHSGESEDEVLNLIRKSVEGMKEYREEKFEGSDSSAAGVKCINKPVCSLVAAVYQGEDWK